jgi:hypothetical protein
MSTQTRRNRPERRKSERRHPTPNRRTALLERRAYPPLGLPARAQPTYTPTEPIYDP